MPPVKVKKIGQLTLPLQAHHLCSG